MLTHHQTILAGFGGFCLLTVLFAELGRSDEPAVRPAASPDPALAAHCSQYIELARAKFGGEWKRRLDPRDTLCAEQVQQAWEVDWQPRNTPSEPVLQAKIVASATSPSKIAATEEESAQRSKTFALAAVTDANATAAKPASSTKPARQDTSVVDFADQRASAASRARQQDASDNDPPSYGAGDQSEMVADEQGQDERAFSPSDGADDEMRTLNDEQLDRQHGYEVQRLPFDDSEVDDDLDDMEAR